MPPIAKFIALVIFTVAVIGIANIAHVSRWKYAFAWDEEAVLNFWVFAFASIATGAALVCW